MKRIILLLIILPFLKLENIKTNIMRSSSLVMIILLLCQSCEKDATHSMVTGLAQKGPFIQGTTITVNELDNHLVQTGKSFTTSIISDFGNFRLEEMKLSSDYLLLTANGYYYSEILGELSKGLLTLQAIGDLSVNENVNINILTHLIKGRIENLVKEGKDLQSSKDQAEMEFLEFLNFTETIDKDFEDMDITRDTELDAALLAFSIIVQKFPWWWYELPIHVAELTELINKLEADFSQDGQIDQQNLIDTLMYNISLTNTIDIRYNLEQKLIEFNESATVPEFEKYIAKFQEKHADHIYTEFYYPERALAIPYYYPDESYPNLLSMSDTIFIRIPGEFCLAAYIPLYASLSVKFTGDRWGDYGEIYSIYDDNSFGWKFIQSSANSFTLVAQKQNQLMTIPIWILYPGKTTIEYFENDSITPSQTRNLEWSY